MVREDVELLREYVEADSESAFAALLSRYVDLVYSVAMRRVGDPHKAEDITQTVFILLARKAKTLRPGTVLPGWLCRTARYVAMDTLKLDRRRQSREQNSQIDSISSEADSRTWDQISPLLDEALSALGRKEHDAIILRYFAGKELKHIGAAMGTTEDAARMRVNRGLETLRQFFTKKGVTMSASAIAGAVAANAVQAAPTGLAAGIIATAFSGSTAVVVGLAAVEKGIVMIALQKAAVAAAFAAVVGVGLYEARQSAKLHTEVQNVQRHRASLEEQINRLQQELAKLRNDNERLSSNIAELPRLRGLVGELKQQLAISTNAPPQETHTATTRGPWRLREPRWANEFRDQGLATPEAAAETILWASQHAPQDLIKMIHLSDESLQQYGDDPRAAAILIDRLANGVRGYTEGPVTMQQQVWLEGGRQGGVLAITGQADDTVITNHYNNVVSFQLTHREDVNDAATERFQDMNLYETNGQWRLVIPGISPDTR